MGSSGLRVAVDATSLLEPLTGVGVVTDALLRGLATRDDVDVTAFAVSIGGRRRLPDVVPPGIATRTPPLPARVLRAWWQRSSWPPLDALLGRPDVVHGPNFVVPPARAARVATVHDLTCLRFPELCTPDVLAYPALLRRAIAEGAWIHTVSASVRAEVLEAFDVDADRVVAVPNGVSPRTGDPARGRAAAGAEHYVLAVGRVEPRKDLPTLVAAADRLVSGPDAVEDLVVVHAGGDGWGVEELTRATAAMDHPQVFRRLGRVDDATLADLYAGARVLAYPSRYEGFGLPVLEAMANDTPVVASDVPAIAEAAGDAALLVPPGDVDALATAITRAWTDDAWRTAAVASGRRRVSAHGWDRAVDGLVELYRMAAAGSVASG